MNRNDMMLLGLLLAPMLITAACSTATGDDDRGSYDTAESGMLDEVEVVAPRPGGLLDEVVVTADGPGLELDEVMVRAARPVPAEAEVTDFGTTADIAN